MCVYEAGRGTLSVRVDVHGSGEIRLAKTARHLLRRGENKCAVITTSHDGKTKSHAIVVPETAAGGIRVARRMKRGRPVPTWPGLVVSWFLIRFLPVR